MCDAKVSEFSKKVKSFAEKLLSILKEMKRNGKTIDEIDKEIKHKSREWVKENFINFATWKRLALVKIINDSYWKLNEKRIRKVTQGSSA